TAARLRDVAIQPVERLIGTQPMVAERTRERPAPDVAFERRRRNDKNRTSRMSNAVAGDLAVEEPLHLAPPSGANAHRTGRPVGQPDEHLAGAAPANDRPHLKLVWRSAPRRLDRFRQPLPG